MSTSIIKQREFTSPRTGLCVATAEWTDFSLAPSQFRGYGVFRLRLLLGSIASNTPRPGWVYTGGNVPPNNTGDQVGPDGDTWVAANFVVRSGQVYTLRLEQQLDTSNNSPALIRGLRTKVRVYKR